METKKRQLKLWVSLTVLVLVLVYSLLGNAGSLEPSEPPGSTMKTLEEVEPRIPIRAADLPLTITEPNSYYLVEDINFMSPSDHAIRIQCDNVTIDFMGYTLKGPDYGSSCGVFMNGSSNVEIRNGVIRDFAFPCIYEQSSTGSSHRVINIRILSGGYGIVLYGSEHLVKDCAALGNIYYGVVTGDNGTLTGNTCCDNGNLGISTGDGCTLTSNTCCDNGDDGIITGDGCTITGNTTMDNTSRGINAGYYCLIDQNTAYSNSGGNLNTGTGCVLGTNCAP